MEAVGFWPRGTSHAGVGVPGSVTPTPSILLFASKPRSVFVLPPPFDPGFGRRLASSSFRMVGYTDISTRNFRIAGDPAILCLIVLSEGTRLGPIAGTGGQTWTTSGTGRNRGKL